MQTQTPVRRSPLQVMPQAVAKAVVDGPYWFVIGGQAVRCLCPYRPSHDVDFGVGSMNNAKQLERHLSSRGQVEVLERGEDTTHLNLDGVDVSIFVLKRLKPYVEDGAIGLTGLLATKAHAILDRGTRRDFFDIYVLMQLHALGLVECITALQDVYETPIHQGLLLRAFAYFDDADSEAPLPGEGSSDWRRVREFFGKAVAALVVPPQHPLHIQAQVVDVRDGQMPKKKRKKPSSPSK